MQREFLSETITGVLRVHVHRAIGLPSREGRDDCSPVATVSIGDSAGVALNTRKHFQQDDDGLKKLY